jgi:polyhydroxyalkanoate synthase
MTEAMAPTNTLSNPAAVKRFFETGGKSLLDGLSNLAKDMVNNGGMPSQVNMEAFEVGKNLGTSEGAVVFRNDVLELIQYKPITEQVHAPAAGGAAADQQVLRVRPEPGKSLARFCLRSQRQTFIVSWRNPTKAQREWGLSTYIDALKEAVDAVLAITGSKDLNMLGACSGGITCTALVGHYAGPGREQGQRPDPAGQRARHHDGHRGRAVRRRADPGGRQAPLLPGRRAGRQRHGQGVRLDAPQRPDLELLGQQLPAGQRPPVFDILFWNNDTTRLPAAFHGDLIEMFKNNPLIRANALEVCGTPST